MARKTTYAAVMQDREFLNLQKLANDEYLEAERTTAEFLEHVRKSGEALRKIKRILGHRTKWTRWRREHFVGSKSTSCDYMQVAKHWDSEKIQEARRGGESITSINQFLTILRRKPKPPSSPSHDDLVGDVIDRLLGKLFRLKDAELSTLKSSLSRDGDMWPYLYERLRSLVIEHVDEDFYRDEVQRREQTDIKFASRMKQVMKKSHRGESTDLSARST